MNGTPAKGQNSPRSGHPDRRFAQPATAETNQLLSSSISSAHHQIKGSHDLYRPAPRVDRHTSTKVIGMLFTMRQGHGSLSSCLRIYAARLIDAGGCQGGVLSWSWLRMAVMIWEAQSVGWWCPRRSAR
jgi:hypothetical protein